jgi:drug/metabolite transporter (DMT)-like permease
VLAITLAIGASLVYGVSDFLGGLKSRSLALLTVLIVSQGTALGFGGFFLAMDAASEGEVQWALLMARLISVTAFVAVFVATRARLDAGRGEVPVLALIGALIIAADGMYAFASTEGLLSVVAVLSSLYPVVTIALARVVLDERIERLQQVGIAVVLGGVVAISAAQA